MSKQRMPISKVVVDTTNNQVFIITKPSKINQAGAYRFGMAQFENLASQLGLDSGQLIRNAKGAILEFDSEPVKAGENWLNKKTGETGVFTKDHYRNTNYSIELSDKKLFALEAAKAAGAAFDFSSLFGLAISEKDNDIEEAMVDEPPFVEEEQEHTT